MGFKFLNKEKFSRLPKNPGVYVFKNGGKILYIGKAANLRERVKNHFSQPGFRDNFFINEVKKIGFISTGSEIEALILEANLIRKYQPKYNIVWRDDKNYFFVGITKEDFPRIFWTHQTKLKIENCKLKIEYVGPFVDGQSLKQALKILRKVFPYRTCKTLPKRPCLWYQLGRCLAPCLLKSKLATEIPTTSIRLKKEGQRNTKNIFKILHGKKSQVLRDLKKEMKKLSGLRDFEKAAKIRDQISALKKVLENARIFGLEGTNVKSHPWDSFYVSWRKINKELKQILKVKKEIARIEAYDVSNIQGEKATGAMVTFINGQPDKNFYRRFKIRITQKPNDILMLKECLIRRIKHLEWPLPDLILIDGGKAQLNAAISCLTCHVKQVKVMALAKKKNELYIEGKKQPVLLKNLPREISNLILQLRDEAHRFAFTYHKKLREIALRNF